MSSNSVSTQKNKLLAVAVVGMIALSAIAIYVVVNDDDEPTMEELLMDALVFTYPMVLVEKTIDTQTNTVLPNYDDGKAPINQFVHTRHLSNADLKDFTMPNVDTIYSFLNFDVSEEPYVLTIPEPDRFFNTQILNAWIDVIAVYGNAGDDCTKIVICSRDSDIEFPDDVIVVRSDTDRGIVASRIFIQNEDDMKNVINIQNDMGFIPWSYYVSGEKYVAPNGDFNEHNEFIPHSEVRKMGLQEYFDFANERMSANHPYDVDADMLNRLAKINVGPGLNFDTSVLGEHPGVMWQKVMGNLYDHILDVSAKFTRTDAVWQYHWDPISNFGTEYEYRAFVAYTGYVANPTSVALYITTKVDSQNDPLSGSKTYVVRFEKDQFPPNMSDGFWSLTVYDSNYFLIDNEIDRYSVNDRMKFIERKDGSVDIILSDYRPDDTTNWLPISGEGLLLTIRIYVPDLDRIDGDWKCPMILPID